MTHGTFSPLRKLYFLVKVKENTRCVHQMICRVCVILRCVIFDVTRDGNNVRRCSSVVVVVVEGQLVL